MSRIKLNRFAVLENNANLNARNAADSADVPIFKVNASDNIEFASFPEKSGSPSTANQLVNKSYVDSVAQGLKPKAAVRASTLIAGTLATSFENGDVIDGVTLATGDRILIKNQASAIDNGIYTVNASGAPTRAVDMDASSEVFGSYTFIQEGSQAGQGWVQAGAFTTLGVDDILFVYFNAAGSVIGGDMITVSGSTISVDLATVSGLESTNPGNAAGQLRNKLEASNPSLQIDGSNQLGVKLYSGGAIVKNSSGVAVNLEASNPSLQISSNELGIKFDAAGALSKGAGGTKVNVDGVTIKITTNALQGLIPKKEDFSPLGATAISNQYIDLANVAATDSIHFIVKSGYPTMEGVDYTVSYTGGAGGKTRISFAGDLATGGASALIAADVVQVKYMYL